MKRAAAIAATVAVLLLLSAANGSTAPPQTTLHAVESEVMCVVCRTPLSVAGGPQAAAQRELIRELIADGKTLDQIKTALVAEYGEQVLALPRETGFNLAVYLVPIAVLLAGLGFAALFLPRWRRHAAAVAPPPLAAELSVEEADRLDAELKRYDG